MQENSKLAILKEHIGQTIEDFGTPLTRWLAPKILELGEGSILFEYTVREDMINSVNTLHGGVLAAIVDDVNGITMMTVLKEEGFHVTMNNVIDYFAPSFLGAKILAKTTIIKRGKQISHVQCEISDAKEGKLLAKGTSNLVFVPKK